MLPREIFEILYAVMARPILVLLEHFSGSFFYFLTLTLSSPTSPHM